MTKKSITAGHKIYSITKIPTSLSLEQTKMWNGRVNYTRTTQRVIKCVMLQIAVTPQRG